MANRRADRQRPHLEIGSLYDEVSPILFSSRAADCLQRLDVKTWGDLLALTSARGLTIHNVGQTAWQEISNVQATLRRHIKVTTSDCATYPTNLASTPFKKYKFSEATRLLFQEHRIHDWNEVFSLKKTDVVTRSGARQRLWIEIQGLQTALLSNSADSPERPSKNTSSGKPKTALSPILDCEDIPIISPDLYGHTDDSCAISPLLYCSAAGTSGKGFLLIDNRFRLLKRSIGRVGMADSCPKSIGVLRAQLLDADHIQPHDDIFHLSCDYYFNSASTAAMFLTGYSRNGCDLWHDVHGKTLKELNIRSHGIPNIPEALLNEEAPELFYCNESGVMASGHITTDRRFRVLKGSTGRHDITPSCRESVENVRDTLRKEGRLTIFRTEFQLLEDVDFNSPSAAAMFLMGNSRNGWDAWKNSKGSSLKEVCILLQGLQESQRSPDNVAGNIDGEMVESDQTLTAVPYSHPLEEISSAHFSVRTWNVLKGLKVDTWGMFLGLNKKTVLSGLFVGKHVWREIEMVQQVLLAEKAETLAGTGGMQADSTDTGDVQVSILASLTQDDPEFPNLNGMQDSHKSPHDSAGDAIGNVVELDAVVESEQKTSTAQYYHPLEELSAGPFSVRTWNVLKGLQVDTWDMFLGLKRETVLSTRNAGERTWNEIEAIQNDIRTKKVAVLTGTEWPNSVQVISSDPVDIIDHLPLFSSAPQCAYTRETLNAVCPTDMLLAHFQWNKGAMMALHRAGLRTVGDILFVPGSALTDTMNISVKTLSEIRRSLNAALMMPLDSINIAGLSDFETMVRMFARMAVGDARNAEIVSDSWGMRGGGKPTLQEQADIHGLTRERVRQILVKWEQHFKSLDVLQLINEFWSSVDNCLTAEGGMMALSDLGKILAQQFHWADPPKATPLASLLELTSAFCVDEERHTILDPFSACPSCPEVIQALDNLFSNDTQEMHILDVGHRLAAFCRAESCKLSTAVSTSFGFGFVNHVVEQTSTAKIQDNHVYGMHSWALQHGKKIREVVRAALAEIGEPSHFTKIAQHIRAHNTHYRNMEDRLVHGCLSNNRAKYFELAGRGTYGLVEWDMQLYKSRVEVISDLLLKHKEPMTEKAIIQTLTESGEYKEANIVGALHDNKTFIMLQPGLYDLRERAEKHEASKEVPLLGKKEDILLVIDGEEIEWGRTDDSETYYIRSQK